MKRRIAFLTAIGKTPTQIKRRLGVEHIGKFLRREDVQALVAEMEQQLFEKGEKDFARLFLCSLKAAKALLEGRPPKPGYARPSRSMIKLVWEAHGRLPQRGKATSGSVYNQQLNVQTPMDPGDVKAAMSLLKEERRRMEAEQTIELDPGAIEK